MKHTMGHSSAMKRSKLLINIAVWKDLGGVMLSRGKQSQKVALTLFI